MKRTRKLVAGQLAWVWILGMPGVSEAEHRFKEEEKAWWAVQPVKEVKIPKGEKHPVDGFVKRKLEGVNLKMSPVASAQEFVRRAYFDLHGLPPSESQISEFVAAWNENQDAAVARLVDELLASPRYGERWAQHWLDVVRYAESDGYREDGFRPNAYLYRDYVVRAFNSDLPYDQFVREQLAADEIAPDDPGKVVATGFLRHGVYEWNQRNAEMQREIMINEITNVTGEAFLGLGVGCAQCHDHKFDPILQEDYFAMQAFLSSTIWPDDHPHATPEEVAAHDQKRIVWEQATAEIRSEIQGLLEKGERSKYEFRVNTFPPEVQEMFRKPAGERTPYEEQIYRLVERQAVREVEMRAKPEQILKKDSPERKRYDELKEKLSGFDHLKPAKLPVSFMSTDTGNQPARVMMPGKTVKEVQPHFLALLGREVPKIEPREKTTGRRSALADWIVRPDNPFTARVMVNRIWQHHFGSGLVSTPNDFGMLGEPPTHPDLLDWLASEFVKGGWLMKPMHRIIMTSHAYRQTARYEPSQTENTIDPSNRFLWRYPPTRLSAEQVRDAMLVLSGELKQRDGGPSQGNGSPVRSLYIKKMRNSPNQVVQCFDAPLGFASEPSRSNTTTPTQSLFLANSEWPLARARAMASKILKGKRAETKEDVLVAFRQAWGREPKPKEVDAALNFLADQRKLTKEIKKGNNNDQGPLVPLAQSFKGAESYLLQGTTSALSLNPGSMYERLKLSKVSLEDDQFTVSAVVNLGRVHSDARVNTIVSQWNGNQGVPGWSLGVTSEKSRYEPRNLIMQLIGHNPGGDVEYEVIASDLRVPLNRPVFISVVVDPRPNGEGTVTFHLKDLSDPAATMQVVEISHNIAGEIRSDQMPILVGGRNGGGNHGWGGQIARLSILPGLLDQAAIESTNREEALIDLNFSNESGEVPHPDTTWVFGNSAKERHATTSEAFTDFCHALLSSNEFLYLH